MTDGTGAVGPVAIPHDFDVFEDAELAMRDVDPTLPAPRLVVMEDADAETLMARIKALRVKATNEAAGIDKEIGARKIDIDALKRAVAHMEADVKYLEEQRARLVEPYQFAQDLYRPSLEAYLLAKIEAKPDGEKSLVLPSGKILSNSPGPKWSFGDEKALALWAKQNLPSVVKEEPVVNKTELKKLVRVEGATGNVYIASDSDSEPVFIPGVKVTTPPREITLEVTL